MIPDTDLDFAGKNPDDLAALNAAAWVVASPVDPALIVRTAIREEGSTGATAHSAMGSDLGKGEYTGRVFRGLIGIDVERKTSGFGVGTKKVKSWARWTVGFGALTIAVGIKSVIQNKEQPSSDKTYVTITGQQARITLGDGSTVRLAPGSKLVTSITPDKRTIALVGEALFSVASSTNIPFVVRTGNIETRVLGTSFGVRRYRNELAVRVAVAEGKVSVNNTVLTLGDVAEATDNGNIDVQHEANMAEVLGWTTGRLAIRELPLKDVVPILSRWYGLEVRFAEQSMEDIKFTSNISTTARPEAVIDVFRALGLIVRRDGNKITISSNSSLNP